MIPSIGDCISICTIVVNCASAYTDAPSNFRQFSNHVSAVVKKLEDIDRKERESGLYIRNADNESRIQFRDVIELIRQALTPAKELEPLYFKIQKRLLERERETPGILPKDLESALREYSKNSDSVPPRPLREPENLLQLLGRKWKQGQFSLKAGTIAGYQAQLDRAEHALHLFLSERTDLRTYRMEYKVDEVHGLLKEMNAAAEARAHLPQRGVEAPRLVLTERQKISCLFVDEENTDSSVLATTYASLIRLWTLANSGSSPYSHISSAGLYVSSTLITPSLYPSLIIHKPGASPSVPSLKSVFPGEEDEDRQSTASFVGSKCSENRRVKLRAYAHKSRGINVEDFANYDLIVAMNRDVYLDLEALRDYVFTKAVDEGKALPIARIRLLESYGYPPSSNEGMEDRLIRFTEHETSWWVPPRRRLGTRKETHCAFRSRESVCSYAAQEARRRVGDGRLLGVDIEVTEMDTKEGTKEMRSLITVTGKFARVEDAMGILEERLSLRKF